MSTHYIDPSDEPRECRCIENQRAAKIEDPAPYPHCWGCNGSGRLGNPEGARVEVREGGGPVSGGFYLRRKFGARWQSWPNSAGPYPTEAAALEAARKDRS